MAYCNDMNTTGTITTVCHTIRAHDGLPPTMWTFEIARIGDRVEVATLKNGREQGALSVPETLAFMRPFVRPSAFRAIRRKVEEAALQVALAA